MPLLEKMGIKPSPSLPSLVSERKSSTIDEIKLPLSFTFDIMPTITRLGGFFDAAQREQLDQLSDKGGMMPDHINRRRSASESNKNFRHPAFRCPPCLHDSDEEGMGDDGEELMYIRRGANATPRPGDEFRQNMIPVDDAVEEYKVQRLKREWRAAAPVKPRPIDHCENKRGEIEGGTNNIKDPELEKIRFASERATACNAGRATELPKMILIHDQNEPLRCGTPRGIKGQCLGVLGMPTYPLFESSRGGSEAEDGDEGSKEQGETKDSDGKGGKKDEVTKKEEAPKKEEPTPILPPRPAVGSYEHRKRLGHPLFPGDPGKREKRKDDQEKA